MSAKKKRTRLYQTEVSDEPMATPDSGIDVSSDSHSLQPAGIVKKYTYLSSGTGIIPIPGVDIAALSFLQYQMVTKLARIYGVPVEKERLRGILASLLSTVISASVIYGPVTRSLVMLTGIGWIMKSAVAVPASGVTTYILGVIFIQHFESGGNLLDFDLDEKKVAYKKKYNKMIKSGTPHEL